jgi:hypothetical protein
MPSLYTRLNGFKRKKLSMDDKHRDKFSLVVQEILEDSSDPDVDLSLLEELQQLFWRVGYHDSSGAITDAILSVDKERK